MGGYQKLVRGEVMRGKFRNSFEKPEPFEAGRSRRRSNFALPDVVPHLPQGHRIMVQVQSSWFPLVDRNPQTFVDIYRATEPPTSARPRTASITPLATRPTWRSVSGGCRDGIPRKVAKAQRRRVRGTVVK